MVVVIVLILGCGDEEEFGFTPPSSSSSQKQETSTDTIESTIESSTDYEVIHNIDCDNVPYVTWDTYMQGMLMTHCQGCHASTSPTRYGAPTEVFFDDIEDALYWSERIRARTLETQDMPPAGGVFIEDLYLLQVWLECFSMYE